MDDINPQEPVGCLWIEGDPMEPDWRYCQQPKKEGSSFCPEHHARCYVKNSSLNAT